MFRQLQESAERLGLSWFVDRRYMRASLKLGDDSTWRSHIPRLRHKRLQRARKKKLAALGTLEFRVVSGKDVSQCTTDEFLRLEGTGWKSESGLLANSDNTQFFAETIRGCRDHGMDLLLRARPERRRDRVDLELPDQRKRFRVQNRPRSRIRDGLPGHTCGIRVPRVGGGQPHGARRDRKRIVGGLVHGGPAARSDPDRERPFLRWQNAGRLWLRAGPTSDDEIERAGDRPTA